MRPTTSWRSSATTGRARQVTAMALDWQAKWRGPGCATLPSSARRPILSRTTSSPEHAGCADTSIVAMRRQHRKPGMVLFNVGPTTDWLADHWQDTEGLPPHVLVEPTDAIDRLDLRFVSLLVDASGPRRAPRPRAAGLRGLRPSRRASRVIGALHQPKAGGLTRSSTRHRWSADVAGMIERDEIDFAEYERATEPALKVRASAFAEDLEQAFVRRGPGDYGPHMRSTKLGRSTRVPQGRGDDLGRLQRPRSRCSPGQVALDLCDMDQRVLIASLRCSPAPPWPAWHAKPCQAVADAAATGDLHRLDRRPAVLFDHVGRLSPSLCLAGGSSPASGQHVFIDSSWRRSASPRKA